MILDGPTVFVRIEPGDSIPDAIVRDDHGKPIGLTVDIVGEGRFMLSLSPITPIRSGEK